MHDDHDIRRTLADLPEPPLPPGLWARVDAARAARARRLRGGIAGALAVVVLAIGVVPRLPQAGAAPDEPVLATTTGTAGAVAGDLEDLRAIDRALQAAYARGASDDEIAPLWQARQRHIPSHVSGT